MQDTGLQLGIRNYVKVGFGNFTTPYLAAAVSFGDGKKVLQIFMQIIFHQRKN